MPDHPATLPILQHPDFKKLAEKYGWNASKQEFPQTLIAKAHSLRVEAAAKVAELKEVEAVILQLDKGKYPIEGATCAVIHQPAGKGTFALAEDTEDEARKLAGDHFASLFDRKVSFKPCEAFDVVATKLLTPARAKKLVALCVKAGAAAKTYLKWS